MNMADSATLLKAAVNAAATDLPDLVRCTTALADALGVTRQAVHAWRRRPDAPQRKDGCWSVREWQAYMQTHRLAEAQNVGRIAAATEICELVISHLPPRITRKRLRQVMDRLKTALHISLAGSRLRSETCDTSKAI
jgi:hypothetical protein